MIIQNINNYCEQNKITVKEFERRCGLSNSLVHKWEMGSANPTLKSLNKIVTVTGIGLAEWLRDEGGNDDGSGQNTRAFG